MTRNGIDVSTASGVTRPTFDGVDIDADGNISDILPTATEGVGLEQGDVLSFEVHDGTVTLTIQEDDLQIAEGFYVESSAAATTAITMTAGQTIYGNYTSVATDSDGAVIVYK